MQILTFHKDCPGLREPDRKGVFWLGPNSLNPFLEKIASHPKSQNGAKPKRLVAKSPCLKIYAVDRKPARERIPRPIAVNSALFAALSTANGASLGFEYWTFCKM